MRDERKEETKMALSKELQRFVVFVVVGQRLGRKREWIVFDRLHKRQVGRFADRSEAEQIAGSLETKDKETNA